ncbi:hypothetical protein ACIQWA_02075 [Kitasatospora sp. NPDC098652]|uniref:hypothetical protein n=1 Tax=Kitasatospora sp. NPDC098652 TaxID=3364095 RepID=UPI003827B949
MQESIRNDRKARLPSARPGTASLVRAVRKRCTFALVAARRQVVRRLHRLPARAGSLLRRACLVAVVLAVLLAAEAALRTTASPSAAFPKTVCRQAAATGQHRIAARHCRGNSARFVAGIKSATGGRTDAHRILRFLLR